MKARIAALAMVWVMVGLVVLPPATVRGISSTVVISEFRVRGPQGGNDEFIELHNVSASAVDISGWTVRGSNSSGAVSIRATVAAGTILQPGCYYLLTNTAANGYSGAVPGNQNYSVGVTDDGGIALALPGTTVTIVDQVGMSAGSLYKEGATLANLGTSNQNRSYERKPGGASGNAADTDNNATDFQLISPSNPQNTSSACIGNNPTNPSGTGAASPPTIEDGTTTTLTVTVTPGANPTSTGLAVSADLSPIGGSATQPFFDDGIQGGDVLAGDNVFTWVATAGSGLVPGATLLAVTITDAESRSGTATINLTVLPQLKAIHEIQGSGAASPLDGQLVRTRGVVTAWKSNGFFLQTPDADADGDPNTSQGIFVFTQVSPPAAALVGNYVEVSGNALEFVPGGDPFSPPFTEIFAPVVTSISSGNPLPAVIVLTAANTDPAGPIDQLEKFEGMRVQVGSVTTVSGTLGSVSEANATGSSNGVFYGVITGVARSFREAGINILDPLPAGSPCCIPRWDANPELLRFDSDGQPGALRIDLTSGTTLTDVIGVLDFGFRTYTILPDPGTPPGVSGIITATALPVPGRNEFTVASMNLERLFDTVNDPATGDVVMNAAALANRLNKMSLAIRNVMNAPDIIGVQEAENLAVLQMLADKLNADAVAAGGSSPNYVAYLEEGNDPGGIDVGFLVKTSRIAVTAVTQVGKLDTYINPNTGTPELLNDRPPLVFEGTVLSTVGPNLQIAVIVNHLRSLIGVDDPADGNRVRTKRASQAEFLASYVKQWRAANPGKEIVLVGDFNAFQFNDGFVDLIGTIRGVPTPAEQVVKASPDLLDPNLVNLVTKIDGAERYSFIFDGNAQVLDHVLTTAHTTERLTRLVYARNNADFPEIYRSDATRSERFSDHDHPVAYFALPPIEVEIDIKPGSRQNKIRLGSHGVVPVVIFSTPTFDAATIDPNSVTLAGAGVHIRKHGRPLAFLRDVNRDGLLDLVVHIDKSDLQLEPSDTIAVLQGMTFDQMFVRGSDAVKILPKRPGHHDEDDEEDDHATGSKDDDKPKKKG